MWRFFLILSISLSVTNAQESVNPCDALTGNQTFAPNPRGCGMYFYCGDNNIPKPGRCPDVYHFHFETQSCELPEDVNCPIDGVLWNTTCPGIGISKVPHEYSCSEYSVCLDDQPVDRSCPAGLHFSPYDQECVDPDIVNCKNDGKTCTGSDPFVPKFIPNSRDCNAFYICFNNILHTLTCGPGQEFDSTTNMCAPSASVNCVPSVNPDLEVPQSLTYDCLSVRNGSRIPHPEHCKFWFWCVNGRSQLFWCGQDASFDSVTNLCTEESLAQCGSMAPRTKMIDDFSSQTEFKDMSATEHKVQFSAVQPRLRVLHRLNDKMVDDTHVETKPEKFYGLF